MSNHCQRMETDDHPFGFISGRKHISFLNYRPFGCIRDCKHINFLNPMALRLHSGTGGKWIEWKSLRLRSGTCVFDDYKIVGSRFDSSQRPGEP